MKSRHHEILRYGNRKLYSLAVSDYVTRARVATFIGDGETVEVRKSDGQRENITTEVLLQVLLWQAEQGCPPPEDMVLMLVQAGQHRINKKQEQAEHVAS